MAGDYLLDTNIVSAILDREPELLTRSISGKVFIPSTVVHVDGLRIEAW